MKNLLSGIGFFFSAASLAQTNIYHEFPDSNAVWNYHYSQYCLSFPVGGTYEADYSIIISGDTVINALSYHKLYIPYVDSTITFGCNIYREGGYKGAFREDVASKKVFYVAEDSTSEMLLYDFNLEVGDTITGWLASWWFGTSIDTVVAVDSVLAGSSYRKRWLLNDWYDIEIIEGIGSTYGLIDLNPGYVTDLPMISLMCFTQDSIPLYFSSSPSFCDLITAVDRPVPEETGFSIYPNPVHHSFSVAAGAGNVKEIRLWNSTGQCVRYWREAGIRYQVRDLPAGAYAVEIIRAEGSPHHRRMIIADGGNK